MFGNQPVRAEFTNLAEQIRAGFCLLEGGDEDSIGATCQQPGEIGFAQAQWQLGQIITVEREAIERVKLHLGVVLAGLQSVEIRSAIDPQQHNLAIDDE